MEHGTSLLITIVAAVGLGLLAQTLAHRWNIPAIVLLLGFGIAAGDRALGLVHPSEMGDGLGILVKLSVAIILFEGALSLNLKALRQNALEVRNLVTIGVAISWLATTLIARFVAGFEWQIAILFGALMTVTGPTVIQPLLRRISVQRSVKTVLEAEAILVDPIGAILAIAVFDVLLVSTGSGFSNILELLWAYFGRLIIGGVLGAAGAFLLAIVLKARNLVTFELRNLVALACVWIAFGAAEWLLSEAGIMAAVAMGLIAQRFDIPGLRHLRHFKESLTTLGISVLFILLAANLDQAILVREGLSGILVVFLIMFVARPLSVFIATWGTGLDWRKKVFIAWIGPRGIIAASVASIFMLGLESAGLEGGERLLALTFMTIIMTVTIQGMSADSVAGILGLRSMGGQKVLIVGANSLGKRIARLLNDMNRPALLVDTNPASVERACQFGVEAVVGNALEEETLSELHVEDYATFLALTSNSEVNVLSCQVAHDSFHVERSFPALSNPAKGANPVLLRQTGGRLAFGRFITLGDWERGDEETHEISWTVPEGAKPVNPHQIDLPPELLPVLLVREDGAEIVHTEQSWTPGSTIIFLSLLRPDDAIQIINAARLQKSDS